MVERLLGVLDRLGVAAQMILVTLDAGVPGMFEMIAVTLGQLHVDLLMTREAFCTADFLSNFMTFHAVCRTLETLMSSDQLTGGELTERRYPHHQDT